VRPILFSYPLVPGEIRFGFWSSLASHSRVDRVYRFFIFFLIIFFFLLLSVSKKKSDFNMTDLPSDALMSSVLDSQAQPLLSDIATPAIQMEVDDTQPRRPGTFQNGGISRVVDETALIVMETFERFVET
jgi:hypothetical protein